jgi:hypothetical protein
MQDSSASLCVLLLKMDWMVENLSEHYARKKNNMCRDSERIKWIQFRHNRSI